jgi:Rad3-related DNA helicase
LIRDEKDRGVAVILDRRAPRFKRYIYDLEESKNLVDDIQGFIGLNYLQEKSRGM